MRFLLFLCCLSLSSCAYYFGNSWQRGFKKIDRTEYPVFTERPTRLDDKALQTHPLVLHWAAKPFETFNQKAKTGSPRVMLAKLLARQDVKAVNEHLLSLQPWGNSGTSGALNPKGDYDFTTILLAAILHRFENDTTVLWKQTSQHIGRVLLIEEGGKEHTKTPRTMAIMKDTENHILMTNISQYLKNQWLQAQGSTDPEYDNAANGMEQFLMELLHEFQLTGPYEFNAKPYEGYTVSALLVMQAYVTSPQLKAEATRTLDMLAWEYMQTSYRFRKSSPFRRRMERASGTSLTDNAMTNMMKAWYLENEKGVFGVEEIAHSHHQAFSALAFDYRPPTALWEEDDSPRLIRIGHGHHSSPEIYSRGKGWMLCAGGFQRGLASQIVARPIVLLLDDDATELEDCFHIRPKGKYPQWNNTGVYHRFAVGNGPVHVPSGFEPKAVNGNWAIYRHNDQDIVVYSTSEMGLMWMAMSQWERVTSPEQDAALLKLYVEHNPDVRKAFKFAQANEIVFDLKKRKGEWVIRKAGRNPLQTNTDKWPRVRVEKMP